MPDWEKKNEKTLIFFCALATVLLVGSFFLRVLVYPCFIVYVAAIFVLDNRRMFQFLLFTFSYAVVFKISSASMSFFTLVELAALMKLVITKRKIQISFLVVTVLLTAEMLVKSWLNIDIIKILMELALFYFFAVDYDHKDAHKYSIYFVVGIVVSSFVGMFKERIPRLLQMYEDLNYEWINGKYTIRFSGIFNDPNYYAIPLILCVVVLLSLLMGGNADNKRRWIPVFGVISAFGFATVSKSFFLVYFLVVVLYALFTKSKGKPMRLVAVVGALTFLLVLNPFGLLDGILSRFSSVDLTTGRTKIWAGYLEVIRESPSSLLFGHGVDAAYVRRPAHNTYIEIVYYVGLIGAILFFAALLIIVHMNASRFRRGVLNYLGFATMAAQLFMLCGFKAYELPFYLSVAYMIYNNDFADGSSLIGRGSRNAEI